MDLRTIAIAQAAGRVGFGVLLSLRPGPAAKGWIGKPGETPGAQVVTAAVGARDLAVGLGTLHALRHGGDAATWLKAGAIADAADAVATVAARNHLSRPVVVAIGALGAVSAVLGVALSRALD
jgi:hypothetical protein